MIILNRIFGSGPLCVITTFIVIILAYYIDIWQQTPKIPIPNFLSSTLFIIATLLTLILAIWSFISLPVKTRGKKLVTSGAFKHIRHPVYASFLDFFVFGLGLYLKSYSIIVAGILALIICAFIVESEEKYLLELFGKEFDDYKKITKKFIPKVL